MNVYEVLKRDHQEARILFQKIEGLGPSNTRQQMFEKLKDLLTRHSKAEEKLFYPKLRDQTQTHDLVEDAFQEHHHIDELLANMETLAPDSDQWLAALHTLSECVEHHVQEEESQMFPKAQPLLGAEAEALGDKIEREERSQARH